MSDSAQVPSESVSSAGSDEVSKVAESNGAEGSREETNSPGHGKIHESTDAEQPRKDQAPKQAPKNAADIGSNVLHSIVGDNPQVTINYFADVFQGKRIKLSRDSDDGTLNQKSDGLDELISEILKLERQGTAYFPGKESVVDSSQLPQNDQEFSAWYYKLSDYEQCYVQVAAVLHGAPAHEVSKRADILYKRLREHIAILESSISTVSRPTDDREAQQRGTSRFSDTFLHKIPGRELRVNTHTISQRIDGVERLYWQDVDPHGLSTFGLHLLAFLSSEFISRGEHGQISLRMLENWSEEGSNEISWKAARSYGVVLWCHNTDRLGEIAEKWAKTNSLRSQRRTAELLVGAFEIERIKSDHEINEKRTSSVVLRLLDDWISRVHKDFRIVNTYLGSAVASTYGLIGRETETREIALDGLERLLKLPQSSPTDETRNIFAAGVSTYVALSWSGNVRHVLERLATSVERWSHQRDIPRTVEERQQYRRHREVHLNVAFKAFYVIAYTSLTEIRENYAMPYSLTEPFPANPTLIDPYGRDVLLMGILSASDVRENITTLLCAAVVEKKSKSFFDFLRYWAEVVLKMGKGRVEEKGEIYLSYQQFLINLGRTIDQWCLDLEKQRLRSPQALDVFKNRLEQWRIEAHYRSNLVGSLAQEVLNQLGG